MLPGWRNRDGIAPGKVAPRQDRVRPVLRDGAVERQGPGRRRGVIGLEAHRRQVADNDPEFGVLRPSARRKPPQEEAEDRRHGEGQHEFRDWLIPTPPPDEAPGFVRQRRQASTLLRAFVIELLPHREGRGVDACSNGDLASGECGRPS